MDEDPVKLVVKNTFVDVGGEEPEKNTNRLDNRRGSDTVVDYGPQRRVAETPLCNPQASFPAEGGGGTFIDDVIDSGTTPSGTLPKHSANADNEPKRVYVKNKFLDVADESGDSFGEETGGRSTRRSQRAGRRDSRDSYQRGYGMTPTPGAGRTPGTTTFGMRKGGTHRNRAGGSTRHSAGGGSSFGFEYNYDGGRRHSFMTDASPSTPHMFPQPGPYMPDPHTGMPVPTNDFGMPTPPPVHPAMFPQPPWMMPGMMPGMPGMPGMPMPGWPVPPMGFQQPPPGYPPANMPMPGMPGMPPPGMMSPDAGGKGGGGHTRTTVMLRNLPPEYDRDMVVELLNKEGFERLYDFVYMPMNLRTMASFGYVFVNLTSPIVADQCRSVFQGLHRWAIPSDKVCDVLWSDEQQGLSSNIERYRNSPVMHESVPEECKPIVLANGVRVPFPAPTKRLREPRIRRPQTGVSKPEDE